MTVYLSVVIPVYNAAPCLEQLVARLEASLARLDRCSEIILLDDASGDGSHTELERLRAIHPRLTVLRNQHNVGQHSTIVRGLSEAKGHLSVIMDCDLQDPPELIPRLLYMLESSGADAVIVRYSNYENGILRYLFSRIHGLLRRFRGLRNNDPKLGAYRIFGPELKAHVLRSYVNGQLLRDLFDPSSWKIEYLDAERAKRYAGNSSYSIARLFQMAFRR